MTQDTYLTGITTTGTPHIGNYVGAIRPGIAASKDPSKKNFYFLIFPGFRNCYNSAIPGFPHVFILRGQNSKI